MSFRHAGLTCFLAFFSSQLNDRSLSFSVMARITRQGFPPAMTLDGISFVTTLPAAMILLSPMVTPGVMVTPPQIHTLFPTVIGHASTMDRRPEREEAASSGRSGKAKEPMHY